MNGQEGRKSETMCIVPIVAAVRKLDAFLGPNRQWTPMNDWQHTFAKLGLARAEELAKLSEAELRAWASTKAEELNAILAREGFKIKLNPFQRGEVGTVSILKVLVEWLVTGTKYPIFTRDGKQYPGVRVPSHGTVQGVHRPLFTVLTVHNHRNPIACVETKSGDKVFMTIADAPKEGFALVDAIDGLRSGCGKSVEKFMRLRFPMIDLDQEVDITSLIGMHTEDEAGVPWDITQALQQTKLRMDEVGAKVESAVAIGATMRGMVPPPPPEFVIDEPFFFWIERLGMTMPILYAYLAEDTWKEPKDL